MARDLGKSLGIVTNPHQISLQYHGWFHGEVYTLNYIQIYVSQQYNLGVRKGYIVDMAMTLLGCQILIILLF